MTQPTKDALNLCFFRVSPLFFTGLAKFTVNSWQNIDCKLIRDKINKQYVTFLRSYSCNEASLSKICVQQIFTQLCSLLYSIFNCIFTKDIPKCGGISERRSQDAWMNTDSDPLKLILLPCKQRNFKLLSIWSPKTQQYSKLRGSGMWKRWKINMFQSRKTQIRCFHFLK